VGNRQIFCNNCLCGGFTFFDGGDQLFIGDTVETPRIGFDKFTNRFFAR